MDLLFRTTKVSPVENEDVADMILSEIRKGYEASFKTSLLKPPYLYIEIETSAELDHLFNLEENFSFTVEYDPLSLDQILRALSKNKAQAQNFPPPKSIISEQKYDNYEEVYIYFSL
jgi:hypothetical protein